MQRGSYIHVETNIYIYSSVDDTVCTIKGNSEHVRLHAIGY